MPTDALKVFSENIWVYAHYSLQSDYIYKWANL